VQALYRDELGRTGSLSELDYWVGVLNAPGGSQGVVAGDILHSAAARDHLVKTWYLTDLGRAAVGGEELAWVNLLLGGQSEEQVLSAVLGSTEFSNHAQVLIGSGTAQQRDVQALYKIFLNRTGSDADVAFWVNSLPTLGLQGVALAFQQTPEARSDLVMAYFNTLLHRPADPVGLSFWANSNLDEAGIRSGIESSQEFFING